MEADVLDGWRFTANREFLVRGRPAGPELLACAVEGPEMSEPRSFREDEMDELRKFLNGDEEAPREHYGQPESRSVYEALKRAASKFEVQVGEKPNEQA